MRVFKDGNWSTGDKCPLCNTNDTGEVVLVPIAEEIDKLEEGDNTVAAIQIHTKCIQEKWVWFDEHKMLMCKWLNDRIRLTNKRKRI